MGNHLGSFALSQSHQVSLIERIKRRMVRMNATSGVELTSLPVTCRRNSTVGGSYYVIMASDTAFIQTIPLAFRVEKGGKSFLGGSEKTYIYNGSIPYLNLGSSSSTAPNPTVEERRVPLLPRFDDSIPA